MHIDASSKIKIENGERVFVNKKYKTKWGSFNIVKAELLLLKRAYKTGGYERYILLSGQDLPLLSNTGIMSFLDGNNNEYIVTNKISLNEWSRKNFVGKILLKSIMTVIKCEFYCGSQWFNLTKNCVEKILNYLVCNKYFIIKFYSVEKLYWKDCSDEKFFHTLVHKIGEINIVNDNIRYIDWTGQYKHPLTLQKNDYERIMRSKALFARKFDETVDKEIIDKIYSEIGA